MLARPDGVVDGLLAHIGGRRWALKGVEGVGLWVEAVQVEEC